MKKARILDTVKPTITSWTWHADLFSSIETNPACYPWIFSNFIQIYSRKDEGNDDKVLFIDFFPGAQVFFECPLIRPQWIMRDTIRRNWGSEIGRAHV